MFAFSARRVVAQGIFCCLLLVVNKIDIAQSMSMPGTAARSTAAPAFDDPASWPIITANNAQYLSLEGVYGHGRNSQALWARDGHTLIVGGDRGVWLYDSRNPGALPHALDEPDLPVLSMVLSHNGRSFAVLAGRTINGGFGVGGSIRVWDLATGTLKMMTPASGNRIEFSPDDSEIIGDGVTFCCGGNAYVSAWDSTTGKLLTTISSGLLDPEVYEGSFVAKASKVIRFSNGLHFAALINPASNGDLQLWSVPQNFPNQNYKVSEQLTDILNNQVYFAQPDRGLFGVKWLGHWLLVLQLDQRKRISVDVIDISTLQTPDGTLSPDGTARIVIDHGVEELRNSQTNRVTAILPGRAVKDFAFSFDDRLLALLTGDKGVDIVDVASGKLEFSLIGHKSSVLHLAFSPDGKWIATTSYDKTVRLWDATTGQQQRVWLPGDQPTILAFSPDSHVLAVSNKGNIVRLWKVDTGGLYANLYGPGSQNIGLLFHPNGLLSIYSSDKLVQWDWGKLKRYDIPLPHQPKLFPRDPGLSIIAVSPDSLTTIASEFIGCDTGASIVLIDNLSGHTKPTTDQCPYVDEFGYANSPDGKLRASEVNIPGNDDLDGQGMVIITPLINRIQLKSLSAIDGFQEFNSVAFSRGGRLVAAINEEGVLVVWRVKYPPPIQF